MKTLLTEILAGVVLCGVSFAQVTTPAPQSNDTEPQRQQSPQATQSASSSGQRGETPRIAPGRVIPVELTKSVDAKKVKTGDEVDAKVTQDLKAQDGDVVVPKDTKVIGHVTEAQARSKTRKESEVGIAFDHTVMKNGSSVELPMSIQAIIAPPTQNAGNNSGVASPGPPPSEPGAGGTAPGASGPPGSSSRSTGMASEAPVPSASGGGWPTGAETQAQATPSINGNTKGVVGISNLQLSAAANKNEGSVVSSEKSNVKLDSGTLLLLRVNQ